MYYIIKDDKKKPFKLKRVEDANDGTYHFMKMLHEDIKGQFGRQDYAQLWCDFENGLISRDDLNLKLNNIANS